jgi:hypothetical protein
MKNLLVTYSCATVRDFHTIPFLFTTNVVKPIPVDEAMWKRTLSGASLGILDEL